MKEYSLEREFGIKENQMYLVSFEGLNGNEHIAKGIVLNFDSNQFVMKAEKGLYIFKRSNVIEMIPVKKRGNNIDEIKCATTIANENNNGRCSPY